tara:strand:+ start:933 stop:1166 length:234 start_codon:yes stop_codon:yes gene_type:complete
MREVFMNTVSHKLLVQDVWNHGAYAYFLPLKDESGEISGYRLKDTKGQIMAEYVEPKDLRLLKQNLAAKGMTAQLLH